MKVTKIKKLAYTMLGILAIISCNDELEFREPTTISGAVPRPVSEVTVENLPGKAKISYSLPDDSNLLYVKASYTLPNGTPQVVKASYYEDVLLIEGFADTLAHEVSVYSVSRSEIESAPVKVNIKPLEAPIWKVFESIEVLNAFGGYNLSATNEFEEDISIQIMRKNDLGAFEVDQYKSIYTSLADITSKVRGLDTLNYEFKMFVIDKWGNSTDTSTVNVLPIYETELSKDKFKGFVLPGDAPQVTNGASLEYAWDNRLGWPYTSFTYQTAGGPDPHMITIDLGSMAQLSRLWYRPFPELNPSQFFYLTTMKRFEIYGSASPSLDGALDDSWLLLGSFILDKPSGSAYGQDTPEDRAAGEAGFNFELDITAPKVRYIRIRCLENYAGGTAQSINELGIYGDPR
ncbi:DUF4959 domain-containing protein [Flammeovirgaceae bacterium SG7u.111]|nr:DUF4959 domain-containing protein [Flammeovirgaceae bacterium SG7u.132]WPO33734.1 DUF4959 domain-containing protein [Flammeovirgaceae bacterium SG7u.111]